METNLELTSHKKVLLFGTKGSGKSTLSKKFETEKFDPNLESTEDG